MKRNQLAALKLTSRTLGVLLASILIPNALVAANNVLTLDGQSDHVTIASSADLQNATATTIEAWVFPTVTAGNLYGSFLNKGDGQSALSDRTYELRWYPNGNIGMWFFLDHVDGAPDAANVVAPVSANTWTHVASTFDSVQGVVRLFTNGVLAAEATSLNGTPVAGRKVRQTTLPVVLGWTPSFSNTYASGGMDEVRVWSKARTPAEIAGNMSCRLAGTEANLAGYWNFEDGNANDRTGHGHDGTLAGNASVVPEVGHTIHAGCNVPCIPHAATATATVVNGFVVGATVTESGCGYTNAPFVLITGTGTGATATATVTDGVVTGINIVNAGSDYTANTLIKIASPPFMPWLETTVTQVSVTLHVVLGRNYILLSSTDLTTWSQVGEKFMAQEEVLTQEFSVDQVGRFFRVQEVP